MGCGCSSFDGRNEMDGLDLASDDNFSNVVTDGEDWTGESEIMRDGMEFGDDRNPMLNLDGDGSDVVVDEDFMVEDEDFDNFLTKKARERAKKRKELRKAGMSRKEARKKARELVPRQPIGNAITEIVAVAQGGQAPTDTRTTENVVTTTNDGANTSGDGVGNETQGMSMGTKIGIGVGVVAVLGIGVYFFMKRRNQ